MRLQHAHRLIFSPIFLNCHHSQIENLMVSTAYEVDKIIVFWISHIYYMQDLFWIMVSLTDNRTYLIWGMLSKKLYLKIFLYKFSDRDNMTLWQKKNIYRKSNLQISHCVDSHLWKHFLKIMIEIINNCVCQDIVMNIYITIFFIIFVIYMSFGLLKGRQVSDNVFFFNQIMHLCC